MLKRISHIGIVLVLLAATTGMTISEHYCGDNLVAKGLFHNTDSCCDDPGCCHDEFKTYILEDEFAPSSFTFEFVQFAFEIPDFVELFIFDAPEVKSFNSLAYIPPPPKIQTVLSSLQTYLI